MSAAFRTREGHANARDICAAMAIVMVLASLPAVGVVFVRAAGAPCLTLNICHPLQSAFPASTAVPLARPAALASVITRFEYPAAAPLAQAPVTRFSSKPDPPPPKISA